MLPFFRKIRWRLAANNQFFKYSRYAIGEIVLVVIGILIALSINNWNIERLERIEEKKILNQFLDDLDAEIDSYNLKNKNLKRKIHYLSLISDGKYSVDTLKLFGQAMTNAFYMPKLNLTYSGLKTSDRLGLITNEKISKMIVRHYEFELAKILLHSKWHMEFTTNTVEDYLVKNLLFLKNGDVDPDHLKSVINTVAIRSIMNYQIDYQTIITREIKSASKSAKELQESISSCLNELKQ